MFLLLFYTIQSGAILLPLLFNIYMSDVPLQDNIIAATCAEDTVIIATSETAEGTLIIAQQHVNEIEK